MTEFPWLSKPLEMYYVAPNEKWLPTPDVEHSQYASHLTAQVSFFFNGRVKSPDPPRTPSW